MVPSRMVGWVLLSLLLQSGPADPGGKQEVVTVTQPDLFKTPEKYQGKLVQVEGVVREVTRPFQVEGKWRYYLMLDSPNLYIYCQGKPGFSKGDRVRVTGKFSYDKRKYTSHELYVEEDGARKVEKAADQ